MGDSCVRSAFQEASSNIFTQEVSSSSSTTTTTTLTTTTTSTPPPIKSTTKSPIKMKTTTDLRSNYVTEYSTTSIPKKTYKPSHGYKKRRRPASTTELPRYKTRTTVKPLDATTRIAISRRTTVMEPQSTPLPSSILFSSSTTTTTVSTTNHRRRTTASQLTTPQSTTEMSISTTTGMITFYFCVNTLSSVEI